MKSNIDIKSALLGLLVGITLMVAVAAGDGSNEIGRYQVSAGGPACAVMVDTKTGQAWAFQPASTAQWRSDANFWDAK